MAVMAAGVAGVAAMQTPRDALAQGQPAPSARPPSPPPPGPSYDETVAWLARTILAEAHYSTPPILYQGSRLTSDVSYGVATVVDCHVTWVDVSVLHHGDDEPDTVHRHAYSFDMAAIGAITSGDVSYRFGGKSKHDRGCRQPDLASLSGRVCLRLKTHPSRGGANAIGHQPSALPKLRRGKRGHTPLK